MGVSRLTNNIFEVENDEMRVGAKAVLVPGVAAGLCSAHELYGKLPRKQVMQPTIELAVEGFEVNRDQTLYLANIMHRMQGVPTLATMWLPNGQPPRSFPQPDRVVQPHLGKLLRRVASEGPEVMYRGEIANALVE